MPEHIHLLISEPTNGTPPTVIQVLKQRVSRRLRRKKRNATGQFRLAFARGDESLCRFWQRRFCDFNVWSLKKRVEKRHCLHMNPSKSRPSKSERVCHPEVQNRLKACATRFAALVETSSVMPRDKINAAVNAIQKSAVEKY
jgi:hypothetical protein